MKQPKKLIIITDCVDVAYSEMKLIIESECAKFGDFAIDFDLVAVKEFSVLNAAFLTRLIAEQCPTGTVLSIVINPQRHRSSRIYGKLSNGIHFFGANTGALTRVIDDIGVEELYEIHDPGFITFGGKAVHAPNVAKLVAEVPFQDFGKPFPKDSIAKLEIPKGTVLHIDNFGLMKMMGKTPVFEEGQKLRVYKNGEYLLDAVFAKRMMSLDDKQRVIYAGSSLNSLPELGAVRHKDGYKEIDAKIGDFITWEPIEHEK